MVVVEVEMVVLGQERTLLIKLGGQFTGQLESTIDSHIQVVLQSRGRVGHGAMVDLLPWVSVLSNKKTQSQVIIPPALRDSVLS